MSYLIMHNAGYCRKQVKSEETGRYHIGKLSRRQCDSANSSPSPYRDEGDRLHANRIDGSR